jgi:hypothetical protein
VSNSGCLGTLVYHYISGVVRAFVRLVWQMAPTRRSGIRITRDSGSRGHARSGGQVTNARVPPTRTRLPAAPGFFRFHNVAIAPARCCCGVLRTCAPRLGDGSAARCTALHCTYRASQLPRRFPPVGSFHRARGRRSRSHRPEPITRTETVGRGDDASPAPMRPACRQRSEAAALLPATRPTPPAFALRLCRCCRLGGRVRCGRAGAASQADGQPPAVAVPRSSRCGEKGTRVPTCASDAEPIRPGNFLVALAPQLSGGDPFRSWGSATSVDAMPCRR